MTEQKRGRRPLHDKVKEAITKIHYRHPDWSIRDIEKKFPEFFPDLPSPGRSYIHNQLKDIVLPNKQKEIESGVDNPWSTASLDMQPISQRGIFELLAVQYNYKMFVSKPMTIREAKWYDRILIVGKEVVLDDPGVTPESEDLFRTNFVATWAQIYAYREKIEKIAGTNDSDYSDYDFAFIQRDFKTPAKFFEKTEVLVHSEPVTEKMLDSFNDIYLMPGLITNIRAIETRYLNHSLGTPDLEGDSFKNYARIITTNLGLNDDFFRQIYPITYRNRIEIFRDLRRLCRDYFEKLNDTYDKGLDETISKVIKQYAAE